VQSASKARRRFGGYIVHLGMIVIIVAVAASSAYVSHTSGTLRAGEQLTLNGYKLKYLGLKEGQEPHRTYMAARVEVTTPSGKVEEFQPRLNYYERTTDPIGTPAVRESAKEDLYMSLMAFTPGGATASLNVWVFPLVGWIWYSIPVLVLGTLISLWPSRRRVAVPSSEPAAGAAATVGGSDMNRGAA
ncbi:MAG TPA: cytochrome c-type biogenesis CcmF C-terminal domain-containing protein, partial [Hyalangium sp.]|nr:cytochrome c-type biogenesis CcmF C-terminal domain-containing protein [Hyalangium sp.]